MIELNYKFKIEGIVDSSIIESYIYVHYTIRWYYGVLPWEYVDKSYTYNIVTNPSKCVGTINPFAHLKARDIPDELIYKMVYNDIEQNRLEDGIKVMTQKKKRSIYKWSNKIVKQVDYNEATGLTKERESAIMGLRKEWYGEDM